MHLNSQVCLFKKNSIPAQLPLESFTSIITENIKNIKMLLKDPGMNKKQKPRKEKKYLKIANNMPETISCFTCTFPIIHCL